MRIRSLSTLALLVVATLSAAGCGSDNPTAPPSARIAPTSASSSLLGSLTGQQTITPLLRTVALPSNLSASANIGPLGGILSLPGAGITVVVPPLAVTSTTKITITALAGSNVAYEFAPHGIQFLAPLVVTQDLHKTQVQSGLVSVLHLGYFPDPAHVTTVTELLNVNVSLWSLTAVATVRHFSGYIFAGG